MAKKIDGRTQFEVNNQAKHGAVVTIPKSNYITINDAPIASNELEKGDVWIDAEIDENSLADFHKQMAWAKNHQDGINVYICSPGGNAFHGLAMYDLIKYYRNHLNKTVYTIGTGYIASAASFIFQAGEKRLITPNVMCLIHQGRTSGFDFKTYEMEDEVNLMKRLQKKLVDIYCERSTLTPEAVKIGWERKDWWLDADQLVEYGLVDQIL